jgi:hypothetical protein
VPVAQEIEGELHDLLFTFSKKEGTKPAVEVVMAHHFSKLQKPEKSREKNELQLSRGESSFLPSLFTRANQKLNNVDINLGCNLN